VLDIQQAERPGDSGAHFVLGKPVLPRRERDVVGDRRRDDLLVHVLEHHADAPTYLPPLLGGRHSEDTDVAFLRLEQAEDVVQHRRLAAPVRAEHGDSAAARGHEVEAAQVHHGAVFVCVPDA
jgi:hypothetical protein